MACAPLIGRQIDGGVSVMCGSGRVVVATLHCQGGVAVIRRDEHLLVVDLNDEIHRIQIAEYVMGIAIDDRLGFIQRTCVCGS